MLCRSISRCILSWCTEGFFSNIVELSLLMKIPGRYEIAPVQNKAWKFRQKIQAIPTFKTLKTLCHICKTLLYRHTDRKGTLSLLDLQFCRCDFICPLHSMWIVVTNFSRLVATYLIRGLQAVYTFEHKKPTCLHSHWFIFAEWWMQQSLAETSSAWSCLSTVLTCPCPKLSPRLHPYHPITGWYKPHGEPGSERVFGPGSGMEWFGSWSELGPLKWNVL